jgi:hypothetical protein
MVSAPQAGAVSMLALDFRGPRMLQQSVARTIARTVALMALSLVTSLASAQTKPRIEKAADLPRFTYKIEGV